LFHLGGGSASQDPICTVAAHVLIIQPRKRFLGAGFLGAPPLFLKDIAEESDDEESPLAPQRTLPVSLYSGVHKWGFSKRGFSNLAFGCIAIIHGKDINC